MTHPFVSLRNSLFRLAFTSLALLTLACSGGEDAGQGATGAAGGTGASGSGSGGRSVPGDFSDAPPVELQDLCPLYTQDLCIYLRQCNDAPYRDQQHCEEELQCFGLPQLEESAARGRVLYNPQAVGACHARFIDDPCGFAFFFFAPDIYQVLAECENTLTPQQERGEECLSDAECVSGYCNKEERKCPGSCDTFAQAGESCAERRCDAELDCVGDVCRGPIALGEPCSESGACYDSNSLSIDGQLVDGSRICDPRTKTCMAAPALGEPCGRIDYGTDTQFFAFCDVGWCNDALPEQPQGTCQPDGALGELCGDCQAGLVCIKTDVSEAFGTCQEPGGEGAPCSSVSDCRDGLRCSEDNVCAALLGPGETCRFDDDCASDICGTSRCLSAAYPGDACGDAARCVFSNCRGGVCVHRLRVGQACTEDGDCATSVCVNRRATTTRSALAPTAAELAVGAA